MAKTKIINVARDYSEEPIGRVPADGEFNGQRFRTEFLVPALRAYEKVIVDFDGTEGYGSSFLDEAFGGLVRDEGFSAADLRGKLEITSKEDPSVGNEIWVYIDELQNR